MINKHRSLIDLADFYGSWSDKNNDQIMYDIDSAERKADAIIKIFPSDLLNSFKTILDFGC